jgi:hypothetical protein
VKLTHWLAGWNMPGYLPETEPVAFNTRDEALGYLADETERWAQDAWGDESGLDEVYMNLSAALEHDRGNTTGDVNHVSMAGNVSLWVTLKPGPLPEAEDA